MIYREIAESEIEGIRTRVGVSMSEKRYRHTLAVEEMASRLADLYCPEKKNKIRAAALLHDITKELGVGQQLDICREYGIELERDAYFAPKTTIL